MKTYVDEKPKDCGLCKIVHINTLDTIENGEMVLQYFCPLLDLSVNPNKLYTNCQLIEQQKGGSK